MKFLVKLIRVIDTDSDEALEDLKANCTYVCYDRWLFEGDEDALHSGIAFTVIGEAAIEGYGDLTQAQLTRMVAREYGVL